VSTLKLLDHTHHTRKDLYACDNYEPDIMSWQPADLPRLYRYRHLTPPKYIISWQPADLPRLYRYRHLTPPKSTSGFARIPNAWLNYSRSRP